MLALMRADTVPNAEILLAKGMDDFRRSQKYRVVLPDPSAPEAAPSAEAVSEDESARRPVALAGSTTCADDETSILLRGAHAQRASISS